MTKICLMKYIYTLILMLGLCSHTYAAEETSEVSVEESNEYDLWGELIN